MKAFSDPLRVHVFPGAFGLVSGSPFCVKLETWLRMVEIPYERVIIEREPKSDTGKAPYVEYADGSYLADSQVIIEQLAELHDCDLDTSLSELERAQSRMLRRTIEEALYFVVFWRRWADPEGWAETKDAYFGKLPWPLRTFVPELIRKQSLRNLKGQGTGRLDEATTIQSGVRDVEAISELLGDRDFFFGEPTVVDATAYATLSGIMSGPLDGPLERSVREDQRLNAYVERMEKRYW
jgi:glutathione S-transferase